jgi:hypothetical protein
MGRKFLLSIALLFFAALPAAAQGILPGSFAGWTANAKGGLAPPVIHDGDHVASFPAANEAAVMKEYGLVAGEQAAYAKGSNTLDVKLYRMKDPSGAYGEYSYLRTPDMVHADIAEHSAMSRDHALVLMGNLVLDIQGHDLPRWKPDLTAIVAGVAPHAQTGLFPSLREQLPTDSMIERSDHYVLGPVALNQFFPVEQGDWLGFSQGVEAELARYRLNGREVTLLLADFPTPQAAQTKFFELQEKLAMNGSNSAKSGDRAPLFAKRAMTLIAIVSGARTRAEADSLLKQVQSNTELTWNEPSIELKEPPFTTMLAGVFIGTGIICCFAIVASLAFGGIRLAVKRVLPHKVFDRTSQLQILQLGLSSKPINAEDFYGIGNEPGK